MERRNHGDERTRILVEFVEVAINSIVFLKSIYPSGAFERRRYMGVIVPRARHPELMEYIHDSISGLRSYIDKGQVERVAVVFYNIDNVPIEKFVFRLSLGQASGSQVEEKDMQFALRSFLIKLSVAEPLTKPLPTDCRWEIIAYFRSLPQEASKEAASWIPTDTKQWQQPSVITPIKSMSSEPVCVQLYVEHPGPSEPVCISC